ncbi:MAG: hypothetical protein HY231_19555 [Acidobacteria bacterium]|nr:hypothetical protein [Acidobacteriota bacterium]
MASIAVAGTPAGSTLRTVRIVLGAVAVNFKSQRCGAFYCKPCAFQFQTTEARAAALGLKIDRDRCSALGSNVMMLKRLMELLNA